MSIEEDSTKWKSSNVDSFSINEVIETRTFSDKDDIYITGIVGRVASKDTSSVLAKLADLLPLHHFGLGHIKRARKFRMSQDSNTDTTTSSNHIIPEITEVFICPAHSFDYVPTELTSSLLSTATYQVCRIPPETAEEFSNWGKQWPIQYRPNETVRKFMRGLPQDDIPMHSYFMSLARQDGSHFMNNATNNCSSSQDNSTNNNILKNSISKLRHLQCPGAIMVNPQTKKVVMTSSDAFKYLISKHGNDQAISLLLCPLSTPTMLTIEGVAACVRGEINSAEETPENYVCCGLDLYIVREPDIMDSMALVHSRIRHVYYMQPDVSDGGLGSCFNIHFVRSLNHHYRVFHCVPD
jgi:hypothetical protein